MNDFGQQRIVDKLLAHVEKSGTDERLRELAAGIRSGNASWTESLRASFYAEALAPGLKGFTSWYDGLDEAERAEQAERYQRELDELNRSQGPDNQ